jgi:hypothetical protein
MTEEEAKALGRRAVACKGFRPMRGMRDFDGRTWTGDLLWRWTDGVDFPDMRDPATLGCLLALVREAGGNQRISPAWDYYNNEGWEVIFRGGRFLADTEAETLVAALEATP